VRTGVQRLQEYKESISKRAVRARFLLENIIRWYSYGSIPNLFGIDPNSYTEYSGSILNVRE
jgi:hypothetical protein